MEPKDIMNDAAFLGLIRVRLASLYHDMNNPLAVASGNVQYVGELVRMGDMEGIPEALADVASAHELIEARLAGLLEVRHMIEERMSALGSGDAG